jgi:hypothetical protein
MWAHAHAPTPSADAPVALTTPSGNDTRTVSGAALKLAQVGNGYEFEADSNDADGDAWTFAANQLPPQGSTGADFSTNVVDAAKAVACPESLSTTTIFRRFSE